MGCEGAKLLSLQLSRLFDVSTAVYESAALCVRNNRIELAICDKGRTRSPVAQIRRVAHSVAQITAKAAQTAISM